MFWISGNNVSGSLSNLSHKSKKLVIAGSKIVVTFSDGGVGKGPCFSIDHWDAQGKGKPLRAKVGQKHKDVCKEDYKRRT